METYEEVIDSWNASDDKIRGVSLTDYIKNNNIKIKEIEMSPLGDFEKILRGDKASGGIMRANYAYGSDDDIEEIQEDETDVIELMKDQGVPYGEQVKGQDSGIMQMAYEPGNYDPELVDAYEQYKYDMNEHKPGMPVMEIDEFIRMYVGDQSKIDPTIRIEEVVKEFIRERGRKPNSLEELKEFYEMRIGTARGSGETDVVKELIEEDKTKIKLASGGLAHILGV